MSTANVLVKSQLEMQEEKNRKIIEAEEKRREREQIHMESQIRNTIELAREKKRIIDKDALKVKQMQDKEKEMEKIRVDTYHLDRRDQ
jgi:hypothetical protein